MANLTLHYTDRTKSPIIIAEQGSNVSTPVKFHGFGSKQYARHLNQALLYILENWANSTPPLNAVEGQLWYNNSTENLHVYSYTEDSPSILAWRLVGGIHYSINPPNNVGQIWYDLATDMVKMYDGVGYKSIGVDFFHLDGDTIPSNTIIGLLTVLGDIVSTGSITVSDLTTTPTLEIGRTLTLAPQLKIKPNVADNFITVEDVSGNLIINSIDGITFNINADNNTLTSTSGKFSIIAAVDGGPYSSAVFQYGWNTTTGRFQFELNRNLNTNSQPIANVSLSTDPTSLVPYSAIQNMKSEADGAVPRSGGTISSGIAVTYNANGGSMVVVQSGGKFALQPSGSQEFKFYRPSFTNLSLSKNSTDILTINSTSGLVLNTGVVDVHNKTIQHVGNPTVVDGSYLINKHEADTTFAPFIPLARTIAKAWCVFDAKTAQLVDHFNMPAVEYSTTTKTFIITTTVTMDSTECCSITSAAGGLQVGEFALPYKTTTMKLTPVATILTSHTILVQLAHIQHTSEYHDATDHSHSYTTDRYAHVPVQYVSMDTTATFWPSPNNIPYKNDMEHYITLAVYGQ